MLQRINVKKIVKEKGESSRLGFELAVAVVRENCESPGTGHAKGKKLQQEPVGMVSCAMRN